jgi:hypothetical protein
LASHIQWQDNSYIEVDSRTRRTVRGPRAPSAPSEPFELVPSQDNRWRIDVPQQFVDAVDASVWGITRRELPAPSAGDDR